MADGGADLPGERVLTLRTVIRKFPSPLNTFILTSTFFIEKMGANLENFDQRQSAVMDRLVINLMSFSILKLCRPQANAPSNEVIIAIKCGMLIRLLSLTELI